MCIMLLAALFLTFLEAATLWLLGVFDRPKFAWYGSFCSQISQEYDDDDEEDIDDAVAVDGSSGLDHPLLSVSAANQFQNKSAQNQTLTKPPAAEQEIYLLMALSKSKKISSKLACPMLGRTRRVIGKTAFQSSASVKSSSSSPPSAASIQHLLAEGAGAYGAPPGTQSIAIALYYLEDGTSVASSNNHLDQTGSENEEPSKKEWGCGWLLGTTTTLKDVQAMMATASRDASIENFIPTCRNDSPSLALELKVLSIRVPGPVIKGRIAWRSVLSPYLARWLHWKRVYEMLDQRPPDQLAQHELPQQEQQQHLQRQQETTSPLGPTETHSQSNTTANDGYDTFPSEPFRRCSAENNIRCEMFMVGHGNVPKYIDYILLSSDRIRLVATTAAAEDGSNPKVKIA